MGGAVAPALPPTLATLLRKHVTAIFSAKTLPLRVFIRQGADCEVLDV